MTMNILLKSLYLDKKAFITSEELRIYARRLKANYPNSIRYLMSRGYIIRIFRGIFYVKDFNELKLGSERYSYTELVAKGMDLKNVKAWYFGLHSALKFNNMTHEDFGIDEIMSSSVFRSNAIKIAGHSFKFYKISPRLLNFGIVNNDDIKYSDKEKTILDFMYIWRYNGVPDDKILAGISEWSKGIDRKKLKRYATNYTKSIAKMTDDV